jgi:hypothetical protein
LKRIKFWDGIENPDDKSCLFAGKDGVASLVAAVAAAQQAVFFPQQNRAEQADYFFGKKYFMIMKINLFTYLNNNLLL